MKECFICKGRGHILSRKQFRRFKEQYTSNSRVRWDALWKSLKSSKAVCRLCHGDKYSLYPGDDN